MSNHDEEMNDRGLAKNLALGLHYGMGPGRLKALAKRFVGGEGQVEPPTDEVETEVFGGFSEADMAIIMAHGEAQRGRYEGYPDGYMNDGTPFRHKDITLVEFVPSEEYGGVIPWMAHQALCGYDRVGEMGLNWAGWLEKYSEYDRGDFGAGSPNQGQLGTPIFQQTVTEELTMADAKAQGRWLEGDEGFAGDEPFMDEAYYLEATKEEWDDEFDEGWKPGEGGI